MLLADAEDDGVGFVRRFGPMHLDAVARQVGFQLQEQVGQLAQVVLADLLAQRAQAFQLFRAGNWAARLVIRKSIAPRKLWRRKGFSTTSLARARKPPRA
jgi:hypothetical protein